MFNALRTTVKQQACPLIPAAYIERFLQRYLAVSNYLPTFVSCSVNGAFVSNREKHQTLWRHHSSTLGKCVSSHWLTALPAALPTGAATASIAINAMADITMLISFALLVRRE